MIWEIGRKTENVTEILDYFLSLNCPLRLGTVLRIDFLEDACNTCVDQTGMCFREKGFVL